MSNSITIKAPADRAVNLISTWGASVYLEPGQEIVAAACFAPLAAAKGCTVISGAPAPVPEAPPVEPGSAAATRAAAIKSAITTLQDRGNADDFRAGGIPKVPPVANIVGFEVTASEIKKATEELLSGNG